MKRQSLIIRIIILILVVGVFIFISMNKSTSSENKTANNEITATEQYKDLQTNDDYLNAIDDSLNYIK